MGKICATRNTCLICSVLAVLALAMLLPATGLAASLNIGSTVLKGGSSYSIECDTGGREQAALYYSIDGGEEVLIHDGPAGDIDPSFDWTPPAVDTTNCVIRLDAYDYVYGDGDQATFGPFTIDSTDPSFSSISVGGGTPHYAKQGDALTITFLASEPLAALPEVNVNGHAAAYVSNDDESYTYSYTVAASDDDGYATITVYGADMAGNDLNPASDSTLLFIDKTAPQVVECSAPTYCATGPVSIDFSVYDPNMAGGASGIKRVFLLVKKNGAGWSDSGVEPISADTGTFTYTAADASYVFGTVAEDKAGNTSANPPALTANLIYDSTPPSITAPPDVSVSTDAGQSYATGVVLGIPTVSDAGSGIAGPATNDAPARFNTGVTNVTWTVSDNAGNTSTCIQKVTVTDGEKPTITAPADVNVNTDAGKSYATVLAEALGAPTISDNCVGATWSNDAPADGHYPKGSTVVTWTVTDVAGNASTDTQTVTVTDNEKPTITAPTDLNVKMDADKSYATVLAAALGTPTVSDNCPGVAWSNDAPADGRYPKGATVVTWTATDASGNKATDTQTITVSDDQKPTITAPADISVNTDAGKAYATLLASALGTPTVNDNCTGVTSSNDAPADNHYPKGVTVVTYTATDASGNTAIDAQTITVTDNEKPTITAPASITVNADAGKTYATILPAALGVPVVSDNCPGATWTNNAPASSQYAKGVTTVTWTATDASGNTRTAAQTITVNATADEIPNAGVASSPSYANALPSVHPIVVTYLGAGDNCASRVVHLWVKKNTGSWTDAKLTSTMSAGSFNYTGMTGSGTYYFDVRTENGTGQFSALPTGNGDTSTVYDTVAPTFTALSVVGNIAKQGASVAIRFTASESLASDPTVKVNGHVATKLAQTGLAYTYKYTILSTDPDGAAVVAVSATDRAANPGSVTSSALLKVDKTAPSTAAVTSSMTDYVFFQNAGLCSVGWTCRDACSGVAQVQFQVSSNGGVTWANYGSAVPYPAVSGVTKLAVASMAASDAYRFRIIVTDKAGNVTTGPPSLAYGIYNQADLQPSVQIVSPVNSMYSVSGMTIALRARVSMPVFHDPRNTAKAYRENDPAFWFANMNGIQPVLREYKRNAYGAPASAPAVKTLATLGTAQRKTQWAAVTTAVRSASSRFLTKTVTVEWQQNYTLSTKLISSTKDVFQLEVPYASVLSRANTRPADKADPGAAVRAREPLVGNRDANYNLLKREFARFWLLR